MRKLQLYSVQELQEKLESVDPKVIINMLGLLQNDRHKSLLIQKMLDNLRSQSIDIRKFPLKQLAELIDNVEKYQPADLKVFYNYVVAAFDSGFLKITAGSFQSMSKIFVLFVKSGFMSPGEKSKFVYSYLLSLKKTLDVTGGKDGKLDNRDLIPVTWALVCLQPAGELSTPILPKLFEQLTEFERPEAPLQKDELIMLH